MTTGKESARRVDVHLISSTGPDVCDTPMGSAMVPVAYSSSALLGQSIRVSTSVRNNSCFDFQLNARAPMSTGHEAGTGRGVVAAGYKGWALVTEASSTVFSEGWASCRHRDPAMINMPDPGPVEPQKPIGPVKV